MSNIDGRVTVWILSLNYSKGARRSPPGASDARAPHPCEKMARCPAQKRCNQTTFTTWRNTLRDSARGLPRYFTIGANW
jgi:hypothetical protein